MATPKSGRYTLFLTYSSEDMLQSQSCIRVNSVLKRGKNKLAYTKSRIRGLYMLLNLTLISGENGGACLFPSVSANRFALSLASFHQGELLL